MRLPDADDLWAILIMIVLSGLIMMVFSCEVRAHGLEKYSQTSTINTGFPGHFNVRLSPGHIC